MEYTTRDFYTAEGGAGCFVQGFLPQPTPTYTALSHSLCVAKGGVRTRGTMCSPQWQYFLVTQFAVGSRKGGGETETLKKAGRE